MRRRLIPLIAVLSLSTAVNAEISDKIHNRCKDASDYMGCVKTNSNSQSKIKSVQKNQDKKQRPAWMVQKLKGCFRYADEKKKNYCIKTYSPYGNPIPENLDLNSEVNNPCKDLKDCEGSVKAQTSSTEDNKYFQDGLNFLNLSDQYKNEESYNIKKLKKYALKAKSSFDKSLEKFPESKEAHFFRGKSIVYSWYGTVELNENDWKTVIKDMNTFIESFPDDPKKGQAYYYIGKSYYTLADDINAILFFSKALNEDLDNNPSELRYLYRAYSERGAARFYSDQSELSLDSAIEDLNKAINLKDHWSGDFYTRGYAKYLKANKFINGKFMRNFPLLKSALIDLNLAIQKNNPEHIIGDSYQLRGLIKRQLGMDDLGLCKDDNSGCSEGCKDISKGIELGGRLTQSAYGASISRMGCEFFN